MEIKAPKKKKSKADQYVRIHADDVNEITNIVTCSLHTSHDSGPVNIYMSITDFLKLREEKFFICLGSYPEGECVSTAAYYP
jgi:hypothetical protein